MSGLVIVQSYLKTGSATSSVFNLTSYVAESTCDGILFERKIEDVTSDLPDLFKNYFIRYQKKMLGQLQIILSP